MYQGEHDWAKGSSLRHASIDIYELCGYSIKALSKAAMQSKPIGARQKHLHMCGVILNIYIYISFNRGCISNLYIVITYYYVLLRALEIILLAIFNLGSLHICVQTLDTSLTRLDALEMILVSSFCTISGTRCQIIRAQPT